MKKSVIMPIIKPGQEGSEEVSKYRPISLLDTGGKVLEKIMINRINHHVYSQGYMNENQYGFRPQKCTIDAAMAIKDFVQQGLAAGEVIALISLDVHGAFDAAWWLAILNELRECKCPKNLYELTKSYFSQHIASWSTNNLRMDKEISSGCTQGSCSGPGLWNLQYNSLLELKYMKRTKVVAFADDLIIATRGESVRAVENYVNVENSKINVWAKNKKTRFNDKKSKVMIVLRIKGKKTRT